MLCHYGYSRLVKTCLHLAVNRKQPTVSCSVCEVLLHPTTWSLPHTGHALLNVEKTTFFYLNHECCTNFIKLCTFNYDITLCGTIELPIRGLYFHVCNIVPLLMRYNWKYRELYGSWIFKFNPKSNHCPWCVPVWQKSAFHCSEASSDLCFRTISKTVMEWKKK